MEEEAGSNTVFLPSIYEKGRESSKSSTDAVELHEISHDFAIGRSKSEEDNDIIDPPSLDLSQNKEPSHKILGCFSKCACIFSCIYFFNKFTDIGKALFQILSQVLYIIDVSTDIYCGTSLIAGTEVNQTMFGNKEYKIYTELVCTNFMNYSHPIWGSINIVFTWIPAFVFLPRLIYSWGHDSKYHKKNLPNAHWIIKLFTILLCFVFWPITGLIM